MTVRFVSDGQKEIATTARRRRPSPSTAVGRRCASAADCGGGIASCDAATGLCACGGAGTGGADCALDACLGTEIASGDRGPARRCARARPPVHERADCRFVVRNGARRALRAVRARVRSRGDVGLQEAFAGEYTGAAGVRQPALRAADRRVSV